MKHYEKPQVVSISKKELNEKILVSASGCSYALCQIGHTYTCNKTSSYACDNYAQGNNPCPSGYSFTCTSSVAHTDALGGEII